MTQQEIEAIVLAEYRYWRDAEGPNPDADLMAMGAMGAAANIYGALKGHRAPWHPQPPPGLGRCPRCLGAKTVMLFDADSTERVLFSAPCPECQTQPQAPPTNEPILP